MGGRKEDERRKKKGFLFSSFGLFLRPYLRGVSSSSCALLSFNKDLKIREREEGKA